MQRVAAATGCANTATPTSTPRAIEERLTMTGTKVEAIHHHGVAVGRGLRRRARAHRRAAPRRRPAEGLHGRPRRGRARDDRVRRAERRRRADGRRRAPGRGDARRDEAGRRRSCAAIVSEGMILAADELELEPGRRSAGIMVLDELTLDAEFAPGTPLADVLPIVDRGARARDHARTGPTASACTASRASCTPRPARRWRRAPWARGPGLAPGRVAAVEVASSARTCARASPRACSRTSRSGPRRCG